MSQSISAIYMNAGGQHPGEGLDHPMGLMDHQILGGSYSVPFIFGKTVATTAR